MSNSTEYVYAAVHPRMPGLVKIGMTTTSPEQRLKELSTPSGVPGPFELLCVAGMPSALDVETTLHALFAANRIPDGEFFEVHRDTVRAAFNLISIPARDEHAHIRSFSQAILAPESDASLTFDDLLAAYTEWCQSKFIDELPIERAASLFTELVQHLEFQIEDRNGAPVILGLTIQAEPTKSIRVAA